MKKKILMIITAVVFLSMTGCAESQGGKASSSAAAQGETTQAVAPVETTQAAAPVETTQAAATQALLPTSSTGVPMVAAAPSAAVPAGMISESQALEIAYQHAKVKAEDVRFHRVKLDIDDGLQEYDVNFYTKDKEYDYDIAAATGEIRSFDYEVEDHVWTGESGGSPAAAITVDEARKSALERVPGANESNIQIKTDMDDGRTVYEGKIIYENVEYEFEIDASTGQFLEWDSESVFD